MKECRSNWIFSRIELRDATVTMCDAHLTMENTVFCIIIFFDDTQHLYCTLQYVSQGHQDPSSSICRRDGGAQTHMGGPCTVSATSFGGFQGSTRLASADELGWPHHHHCQTPDGAARANSTSPLSDAMRMASTRVVVDAAVVQGRMPVGLGGRRRGSGVRQADAGIFRSSHAFNCQTM